MIDKARWHFTKAEHLQHPDPKGWRKLQEVDIHVGRGIAVRKIRDWKSAVREADAAIAAGADSAPLVTTSSWSIFFLLIEIVSVFLFSFGCGFHIDTVFAVTCLEVRSTPPAPQARGG
jgi:hypothetical protein